MNQIPHGIKKLKSQGEITKWIEVQRHTSLLASPKLTNETFFRSEIFRQASRDSLEHVSQDPAVVEGDCEQVQSPNEVWELPR